MTVHPRRAPCERAARHNLYVSGKARRARRRFSDELWAGAVALVLKESGSVTQVAKILDLTDSALRDGS